MRTIQKRNIRNAIILTILSFISISRLAGNPWGAAATVGNSGNPVNPWGISESNSDRASQRDSGDKDILPLLSPEQTAQWIAAKKQIKEANEQTKTAQFWLERTESGPISGNVEGARSRGAQMMAEANEKLAKAENVLENIRRTVKKDSSNQSLPAAQAKQKGNNSKIQSPIYDSNLNIIQKAVLSQTELARAQALIEDGKRKIQDAVLYDQEIKRLQRQSTNGDVANLLKMQRDMKSEGAELCAQGNELKKYIEDLYSELEQKFPSITITSSRGEVINAIPLCYQNNNLIIQKDRHIFAVKYSDLSSYNKNSIDNALLNNKEKIEKEWDTKKADDKIDELNKNKETIFEEDRFYLITKNNFEHKLCKIINGDVYFSNFNTGYVPPEQSEKPPHAESLLKDGYTIESDESVAEKFSPNLSVCARYFAASQNFPRPYDVKLKDRKTIVTVIRTYTNEIYIIEYAAKWKMLADAIVEYSENGYEHINMVIVYQFKYQKEYKNTIINYLQKMGIRELGIHELPGYLPEIQEILRKYEENTSPLYRRAL